MILDTIAEKTRERVAALKREKSFAAVQAEALKLSNDNGFPFEAALRTHTPAFICEVKKASPSKGVIAEDFPYLAIAQDYEAAGAAAISVLTEPYFFLGSDAYLTEIVQAVSIPVLRKDFTVDAYQIYEAKTIGAQAALLICALLDRMMLRDYIETAHGLGLTALVEAHSEREVEQALKAGARVIGVNNRDLQTFEVDVSLSLKLRALVPPEVLFVSESGISSYEQVARLKQANVNGVLIGETLMRSKDRKAALDALRGGEA